MDPSTAQRRIASRTQRALEVARWAVVVMAAATLLLGAFSALAAAMLQEPRQVVLLRTGRIIEGEVLREPDRWAVRLGTGGYIRLELDQVDLVADDLEGIRAAMQARVGRGQLSERVKIARFCIQHGMYDAAEEEIGWLRDDGLDPATLDRLSSHLAVARRPTRPRASETSPSERVNAAPEVVGSTEADAEGVAETKIDPQLMTVFVQRIQPPLLVGCAAAKCHGPQGTTAFRLQRMELGTPPTRRMSLANYRQLHRLALTGTAEGTVTDWALRAHGGRKDPVWRADDSKVTELQAWLAWVRQSESGAVASTTTPGTQGSGVQPASFQEGKAAPAGAVSDPYDPELFHAYIRRRQSGGDDRSSGASRSSSPMAIAEPMTPSAESQENEVLKIMASDQTPAPILLPPRDQ